MSVRVYECVTVCRILQYLYEILYKKKSKNLSSGSHIIAWAIENTAHTNRNGYHSCLRLLCLTQVRRPEFPESDNEVLKRKRKTERKKKVGETAAVTNHIGDNVFVVAVFRIIYVSF